MDLLLDAFQSHLGVGINEQQRVDTTVVCDRPIAGAAIEAADEAESRNNDAGVIVAASLLAASIGLLLPLGISTGKLWQETRQLRMASDLLVSQLEMLTHIDQEQIAQRLEQLQLSEELKAILPAARFTHRVTEQAGAVQIELSLDWDRGHPAVPLTLVGWNHRNTQGNDR